MKVINWSIRILTYTLAIEVIYKVSLRPKVRRAVGVDSLSVHDIPSYYSKGGGI